MGRLPAEFGCDAPPGYARKRASITSWLAWKEHAACRGRLPRSLRREASSEKFGCYVPPKGRQHKEQQIREKGTAIERKKCQRKGLVFVGTPENDLEGPGYVQGRYNQQTLV